MKDSACLILRKYIPTIETSNEFGHWPLVLQWNDTILHGALRYFKSSSLTLHSEISINMEDIAI